MELFADNNLMEIDDDKSENHPKIISFQTVSYKPNKDTHKQMVTHVVWPSFLPQRKPIELDEHEICLVELMVDIVDWFEREQILSQTMCRLIQSLHNVKTSMRPDVISREFSQQQPGEMKSIYIDGQNCCLFVYMPPISEHCHVKQLMISTFPLSVNAEQISNYTSSDVKVNQEKKNSVFFRLTFSILFSNKETRKEMKKIAIFDIEFLIFFFHFSRT